MIYAIALFAALVCAINGHFSPELVMSVVVAICGAFDRWRLIGSRSSGGGLG